MESSVRGSARRRATAGGLAALLLAGGAVGCQKGAAEQSPEMTPAAAVAKAAKNSEDITSLRYRMTGDIPGEGRVTGDAAMSMKPLAMSMRMTAQGQATDKGRLDMKITFLDINEPVKVAAPPAKDTADLAEMLKGAQG